MTLGLAEFWKLFLSSINKLVRATLKAYLKNKGVLGKRYKFAAPPPFSFRPGKKTKYYSTSRWLEINFSV